MDNSTLPWATQGNSPWYAQSTTYLSGGSSAQSGAVLNGGSTVIKTTVTGPGTLRFNWKVSSENGFDYLSFQFDGWDQVAISGEIGWEAQEWGIPEGNHVLSWVYSKDASASSGSDAGWLDLVTYTPGAPAPSARAPIASPAALIRRTTGGRPAPQPKALIPTATGP